MTVLSEKGGRTFAGIKLIRQKQQNRVRQYQNEESGCNKKQKMSVLSALALN